MNTTVLDVPHLLTAQKKGGRDTMTQRWAPVSAIYFTHFSKHKKLISHSKYKTVLD